MLIGYMRVLKSDGSQSLDLQKGALREADVSEGGFMKTLTQEGKMSVLSCLLV